MKILVLTLGVLITVSAHAGVVVEAYDVECVLSNEEKINYKIYADDIEVKWMNNGHLIVSGVEVGLTRASKLDEPNFFFWCLVPEMDKKIVLSCVSGSVAEKKMVFSADNNRCEY